MPPNAPETPPPESPGPVATGSPAQPNGQLKDPSVATSETPSAVRSEGPAPVHHLPYERVGVLGDVLRGSLGAVIVITPLFTLELHVAMQLLLGALGGLFGWFALRNVMRLKTTITATGDALIIKGWTSEHLAWDDLTRYQARYFSTRRDRSDGWLQLTLWRAKGRTINIDSGLHDFDQLAEHVAFHGKRKDLVVDDATIENLIAIGVPTRFFMAVPASAAPQQSAPSNGGTNHGKLP